MLFSKQIFIVVAYLQISADDLFGIYCSDDEYPAEIQEVLTEIALKVKSN